ncbi:MAG TPA: hypothetical protein VF189_03130 [Patescibacteria group bacterium]
MQPQSAQDYKNLLTEVIKKQIVILGPDITLSKARNVKGLTVMDDGTVTAVSGSPQEVTQALIDQFVQLSGLIVKKTMEPLLLGTQNQFSETTPQIAQPQMPVAPQQMPAQNTPMQPMTNQTNQIPQSPQTPSQQTAQTENQPAQPAKNPLAA